MEKWKRITAIVKKNKNEVTDEENNCQLNHVVQYS